MFFPPSLNLLALEEIKKAVLILADLDLAPDHIPGLKFLDAHIEPLFPALAHLGDVILSLVLVLLKFEL